MSMSWKDIKTGIAFLLILATCFWFPAWVDAVMVDRPCGIYAQEWRG